MSGAAHMAAGEGRAASPLAPYLGTFSQRLQLTLQYRAAAIAGFFTQSWFGGILIMVLAAFYSLNPARAGALSLSQAITYTWLSQATLALIPMFGGDPQVTAAVRTGAVAYDRLRPIDTYAYWYTGAAGYMIARAAPRFALIFAFAAVAMPLAGFGDWSWRVPASFVAGALYAVSLVLVVTLASAMMVLVNLMTVVTLDNRGLISITGALIMLLSGNVLPLQLYPDWMHAFLFVQPIAGVLDIPARIYFGQLTGPMALAGLGLQAFWTFTLVAIGWTWTGSVMRRLQVQGG